MKSRKSSKDIGRIVWPEPRLADDKEWQRGVGVVIMLCNMGKVVGWTENDSYPHFPSSYRISGVVVEFLPNWAQYNVGPVTLSIPECEEDVLNAISAVKEMLTARAKLNRFGLGRFKQD